MNVQPSSGRDQKVAAVPVTEGKVELAVANHEFPVGFPTADPPSVPGTDVVVVFVYGVGLIEAQKAEFPFHAEMPPQVEIHKAADAEQVVWSVVGAVRGKKSSCQPGGRHPGPQQLPGLEEEHSKRDSRRGSRHTSRYLLFMRTTQMVSPDTMQRRGRFKSTPPLSCGCSEDIPLG